MKEVEELGQQSQNLDCENRRAEHKAEILKSRDNVSECINALYSFSISLEKKDQVNSVVLSRSLKKDIERFWLVGIKSSLINARNPSLLK